MRRLGSFALAALCALGGCSVMSTVRSGSPLTTPTPTRPTASVIPTAEDDGSPTRHIVREQLQSLIGKTADEAKVLLRGYGHDGEVKVAPGPHYFDECTRDRVCAFDVPESGMGAHDPVTLYVNPALKIAAPPP